MSYISSRIDKIKQLIRKVEKFITVDVWNLDTSELSKAKARLIDDTKIIINVLMDFKDGKIGFQSVALSYFCTMAAVPFIAVGFAITSGFGLEDKLSNVLYSANISQNLIDVLMNSASNIIKDARSGVFGLISALMFVWLVIWMMMRVETVFNNVWKVKKTHRKFIKSFGIDVLIMCLSPFVIMLFFTGSIVYSHVLDLLPKYPGITDSIKTFLGWVVFCSAVVLVLSAMYKFIPAAKVRYRYALHAAILSGIAFTILQYLYLETQVMVMRISAVYGTAAAIPLFMIWLRFGWLIILYGAQFSYSFQKNDEHEEPALLTESAKQ